MRLSTIPDLIVVEKNNFDPLVVIQGRANTCSVVVALINIANYFKMFKINLLKDIIYPQKVKFLKTYLLIIKIVLKKTSLFTLHIINALILEQ